jgi:CRP-like cAMP-binding protein
LRKEQCRWVYFIENGTAKLYKIGFNRKEQILRFIKEGDIIGYRALLIGEAYQATAEAMSDLQAIFIPTMFFYIF